ncbi:MAG: hypothetical protein BWY56_02562 [Acidobacteria bacterium ADurb.Bin340]|nr:MAG: hypothetical protein BWY56_02562 [Acidobacteria bacterium ADurb.Bin340]
MSPNPGGQPTVVVARRVRPGCEDVFQEWADGFTREVTSRAGCLTCQLVPPLGKAQPEWVFVSTFDTPQNLRAWIESPERAQWLAQAEPLVEGPGEAQVISGLEQLFGLLPPTVAPPPPVWKVAVSVLVGLYPLTLFSQAVLGPLLGGWPLPVRGAVSAVLMVILMTWVVMPGVTRALKPWLYPRRSR